ncbi:MAG: DUF1622 domain-containing protein [Micrococcaceae bacterium]
MEKIIATFVTSLELLGAVTMILGFIVAFLFALRAMSHGQPGQQAFQLLRKLIGSSILLGLEILVAADLLRTMMTPTLNDVLVLALIVLIRTFLSISIQIEIEGMLPWKRAMFESGGQILTRELKQQIKNPGQAKTKETTTQNKRNVVTGSFDSPVTRVTESNPTQLQVHHTQTQLQHQQEQVHKKQQQEQQLVQTQSHQHLEPVQTFETQTHVKKPAHLQHEQYQHPVPQVPQQVYDDGVRYNANQEQFTAYNNAENPYYNK